MIEKTNSDKGIKLNNFVHKIFRTFHKSAWEIGGYEEFFLIYPIISAKLCLYMIIIQD